VKVDDQDDIQRAISDIIVGSFSIIVATTNKKSGKKIIFVRIIKLTIGVWKYLCVFFK
ncbi:hypothetical protein HGQ81_19530, partial [Clostridioides difficile]|nr:hypothetical protein [Clostridioides difficile]